MTLISRVMFSRLPGGAMNLKQFMLRQQVLRLYRDILRSIYLIENPEYRRELRDWARHDFQKHKHLKDEEAIKMMITMGHRHLKELQAAVNLVR